MKSVLSMILGVDLRSLAAFRIGIALLLLADLWSRSRDLMAHYTAAGVLGGSARFAGFRVADDTGLNYQWSLHDISGNYWFQVALFLVAAFFAVWLLIGYRTQLAALISWVLLVSLQTLNPLVLSGGDVLLRCLLFWALFLPLGALASVDSRLRPPSAPLPKSVLSVASAALLLQVCMMYMFSVVLKQHPRWMGEFTAIYYVLSLDAYVTPLGHWLLQYPELLRVLTACTFFLEWAGPIIVFAPVANGWLRLLVVLAFWLFHVSLMLTMELGLFALICMVAWIPFLPSCFWDTVLSRKPLRWFVDKLLTIPARGLRQLTNLIPFQNPETPELRLGWISSTLCATLLLYVVAWNIRESDFTYWEARLLPQESNVIGRVSGLHQRWDMFAPYPLTHDGWYEMKGTLRDGTEANLWEPGTALPVEKPKLVSATYHNQRWRKYLLNLWSEQHREQHRYLAGWLKRRWDQEIAAGEESRMVAAVQIVFHLEQTPEPHEAVPEPEPVTVWTARYDNELGTVKLSKKQNAGK